MKGGYLKGKSHKKGGIPAIVGGTTPVELEGGEYIIRKSSVDKLGSKVLDEINKKGRIPIMETGGKVKKTSQWRKSSKKDFNPKDIKTMREIMLEEAGLEANEKRKISKWRKPKSKKVDKPIREKTAKPKYKAAPRPKKDSEKYIPLSMETGGKVKKYKKGDKVSKKIFTEQQEKSGVADLTRKSMKKMNFDPNKPAGGKKKLSEMKHGSQERIAEYKRRGWALDETTGKKVTKKETPKTATDFFGSGKTEKLTTKRGGKKSLGTKSDVMKKNKDKKNKPVKPKVPFTDNSLGDTGPDKKIKISKKKYDFSKPGAREARKRERRRTEVQERLKKAKPIDKTKLGKIKEDKSGPLTKTSDFAKKVTKEKCLEIH